MSGRLDSTPWGRNAIAAYLPGGIAGLITRIPAGHTLSVSARSARGPWQVRVIHNGAEVFRREPQTAEFPAVIEQALGQVWP